MSQKVVEIVLGIGAGVFALAACLFALFAVGAFYGVIAAGIYNAFKWLT